eukprot:3780235-Rhodomonas_salina.2
MGAVGCLDVGDKNREVFQHSRFQRSTLPLTMRSSVLKLTTVAACACLAMVPGTNAFALSKGVAPMTLRKAHSISSTRSPLLQPAASARRSALSGAAAASMNAPPGYNIDLTGKVAFIAGVADSTGYGWAIAKQLANAGATIVVGTWPPVLTIFERGLKKGFGDDAKLRNGEDMKIAKIYPLDGEPLDEHASMCIAHMNCHLSRALSAS